MTPEAYVQSVLLRHQTNSSIPVAQGLINILRGSIEPWANIHLEGIYPSGSIAKGTAISGLSDVDILVSIRNSANETLKEIYDSLYTKLSEDGYSPTKQNVSLGLILNGRKIDVVPAKRQQTTLFSTEHSLWSHKHSNA